MSRTPDERLFSSGDNDSFCFTQCYVSFGDPDGEDFAFTKCNGDGSFTLTGLPMGIGDSPSSTSGTTCWWMGFRLRSVPVSAMQTPGIWARLP